MPIYKQNLQHIQPFISVPLLLSVTQICIQVSVLGQKFYKQYKPNKIYFWFFLFKILFYLPTIQIQEYFVGLWQHHWIMTQKPKQWKILEEDYVMCFSLWVHKQASQTKYLNIFLYPSRFLSQFNYLFIHFHQSFGGLFKHFVDLKELLNFTRFSTN